MLRTPATFDGSLAAVDFVRFPVSDILLVVYEFFSTDPCSYVRQFLVSLANLAEVCACYMKGGTRCELWKPSHAVRFAD